MRQISRTVFLSPVLAAILAVLSGGCVPKTPVPLDDYRRSVSKDLNRDGVAGRVDPKRFPESGGGFEVRDGRLFLSGGVKAGPVELVAVKEGLK